MSKQKLTIECHDCGEETTVIISEDDSVDIINHCPRCGSDNIEVS